MMEKFGLYFRRAVFGLVLLANPNIALALDRDSVYHLQLTLNEHGFSVGDPDGQIGPATRRGLREFADAYNAPNDPEEAFLFIASLSGENRTEVTDADFLNSVEQSVAEYLLDPSSVVIRNVYKVANADTEIVCGEVDGKNENGAYAGFTPFYGMAFGRTFLTLAIDDPDITVAQYTCLTAFPKRM